MQHARTEVEKSGLREFLQVGYMNHTFPAFHCFLLVSAELNLAILARLEIFRYLDGKDLTGTID